MSWDPVWEEIFRARGWSGWGKYPPEELIRFVARRFYGVPDRARVKILDVGCGPGPAVWYLAREGFDAYGIDGSETGIAEAYDRLRAERLGADLQVGDLVALRDRYPVGRFDAVTDVTAIQQNRLETIERIVGQIYDVLRPGGRFFSMLVAEGSWGEGLGRELEPGTFTEIREGPLVGAGVSHFFTLTEVERLLAPFTEVTIDESSRTLENRRHRYSHWVAEGTRPA